MFKVKQIKAECETQITQHLARATEAHLLTVRDMEEQQEAKLVQKHATIMQDLVQTTEKRNVKVLTEMQKQMSEINELVKGEIILSCYFHRFIFLILQHLLSLQYFILL